LREVYAAVPDDPFPLLGELHYSTFGLEKEEVLGVGDGDGGVCLLRAGCNLIADGVDEELCVHD
jgi:hypothetical protein